MTTSIKDRALLVTVNISTWSARKLDKQATASVHATFQTRRDAGQFSKKLLPGADSLAKATRAANDARQYVYANTLPWLSDGTRILAACNFMAFSKGLREHQAKFDAAVNEFVTEYPQLCHDAQAKLGALYNAGEYPHDIASRFSLDVNFLPMPAQEDFRVEMSEEQRAEFTNKLRSVEENAMRDAWQRLREVIRAASERLAKPDAIFRDSLIENIAEIAAKTPHINISDDAQLNRIAQEAKQLAEKTNPDNLRESPHDRAAMLEKLAAIDAQMSAFMGFGAA